MGLEKGVASGGGGGGTDLRGGGDERRRMKRLRIVYFSVEKKSAIQEPG